MDMRLDGLATGMDTRNVIEQLMEVEREPIEKKENDIAEIEQKQEMWRDVRKDVKGFEDAFSTLQDKETFETMDLSSTNDRIVATDAEPDAVEGDYNVSVDQVAQKHEVQSDPIELEDIDDSLIDDDNGVINIEEGEEISFEIGLSEGEDGTAIVEVSRENDEINISVDGEEVDSLSEDDFTLEEFAQILDENIDNVNTRIASVDDDFHLEFEGAEYGRDLYLEDNEGEVLAGDLGIIDGQEGPDNIVEENELQQPQYAEFEVDGRRFDDHDSNTVEIDGVTIDISGADPQNDNGVSDDATITVQQDLETPRQAIGELIESYNLLKERLDELGGEEAPLQGDSTLRMIENRMRSAISNVVPDNAGDDDQGIVPSNMGLEFATDPERSGYLLGPDEENFLGENIGDKIDENLTDNLEEMKTLFADDEHGIANRLQETTDLVLRGESDIIDNRVDNLGNEMERISNRIGQREERIERREERLWGEFSRMEQAMQEMNSMQQGMRNQLDQLRGMEG